jgi:DNA-binding LacI/PurR family transcriptional regulator
VSDAVRARIVDGQWPPGATLPPRIELLRELRTTPVTLHRAVQRLVHDGFLRTEPGAGTFVADAPPHLSTYAVVFVFDPASRMAEHTWSRYPESLTRAAKALQATTGRRMLLFHGIDEHADSEDRLRLLTRIERHSLAGIIFTHQPFLLEGTPILEQPGMPRVALASAQSYPHVPIVNYDSAMWLDKALDHLAAAGRRRVAVIGFGFEPRLEARFQAGLAARGMVSHTRWRQFVSLQWQHGARHAAELLMHDRERPDALLVTDDNFVEDAVAGVAAAGLRVPACGEPCRTDDVAVVGHANFPVPPAKSLPLRLLGYDAHRAMRACVDLIDRQRRGEKVPGETVLSALWEEEVGNEEESHRSERRKGGKERVLAAV